MNEKKVQFDTDTKEVLLKALKDLHFANSQLHEWVKKDNLNENMAKTLPSLIESHFCDIAKYLDYTSHLTEEQEKRYEEIRNANLKIQKLQAKLASSKPIDGLKEQLTELSDCVSKWWRKYGFKYVRNQEYTSLGYYKVDFGFMLDHITSLLTATPATDRKKAGDHIQDLKDQGFEFSSSRTRDYELIDNQNNRDLLINMLEQRFPSINIISFKNWSSSTDDGTFVIREVETIIYDLTDIPSSEEGMEEDVAAN
jgi:hypothetical protein